MTKPDRKTSYRSIQYPQLSSDAVIIVQRELEARGLEISQSSLHPNPYASDVQKHAINVLSLAAKDQLFRAGMKQEYSELMHALGSYDKFASQQEQRAKRQKSGRTSPLEDLL